MASASCSSTCIPRRELRCHLSFCTRANNVAILHGSVQNLLCACRVRLLFYGDTAHNLSIAKEKSLRYAWKEYSKIQRKSIFKEWSLEKQHKHLVKAVAVVEPMYLVPESSHEYDRDLQLDSSSDSQLFNSSNDETLEMDEKEKLRRMRISKANKGNVPWNKGRKHSAETLQRIKERTRLAMQDPKVKMKLVNLGHAQSEETRVKIGVGVREGWQRRREMLMVQESCLLEWQNMVAEASRKGYASEDGLQWDSYRILDEQLKKEWLESVEKRKTMPRPKGSKRAPKSLEQRRKISESISAKWADPEYRERVCSALAKYHGIPVGAGRKARRKPTGETKSVNRESARIKPTQPEEVNDEPKSIQKPTPRRRRNAAPSYKDPMASSKLEMIKKIRAERAAMETKKREATERAKLLIAEAERAAKALEVVALTSPLAQASLLETRKLIAEATRSIESIETGQLVSRDTADETYSSGSVNHFQTSTEISNTGTHFDERQMNGFYVTSKKSDYRYPEIDQFGWQNSLRTGESLPLTSNGDGELIPGNSSPALQPNNVVKEVSGISDSQAGQLKVNGSIRYNSLSPEREEDETRESSYKASPTHATKTKKWVRGRLVEVGED